MVAFLSFADGEPFATGFSEYAYIPATEGENLPRILLPVAISGISTSAVMDTGAPYVVCAPVMARNIDLKPETSLGAIRLLVRGYSVAGRLHRLNVSFEALQGESLTVDATVFVPDAEWEEIWGNLPPFIGLSGCLERMRFAVDPGSDTFYFGPL
jgi:hypothetical protein